MNRRLLNTDLAHLSWQRVTRASAADTIAILDAAVRVSLAWRGHLRSVVPELVADAEVYAAQMVYAQNALKGIPPITTGEIATTTNSAPILDHIHIMWPEPEPESDGG